MANKDVMPSIGIPKY